MADEKRTLATEIFGNSPRCQRALVWTSHTGAYGEGPVSKSRSPCRSGELRDKYNFDGLPEFYSTPSPVGDCSGVTTVMPATDLCITLDLYTLG